jgi:hypothetical protein
MPDNLTPTRIEPLSSGVNGSAEKEGEYPRPKERRKASAVEKKPAAPLVEIENEVEHQLDEQA